MTTHRTILFLSLICCLPQFAHAQLEDSTVSGGSTLGVIDTIIVGGNHKTQAYVILNEMTLKPGSVATASAIEFDRNRIYSLGLFTHVDIFYDSLEGQRFLYVEVSERWHIIPLPIFGFRDGDPKKPYYGGGVLHNNFRGRNQKLLASAVFGYNPSLSLWFQDPLIDRENSLYFSASVSASRIRNKSARESALSGDFDERHYDANVTLGKRFTLYENAGFNVGYRIISIDEYRPGRTASPTGKDMFLYGGIQYVSDTRDLREYASMGHFFALSVTRNGFGESDVSFTRFGADYRRYVPLPLDFTFAGRLHGTVVSGGTVPTYSRVYFGYGERIRGYYTDVFEGENMLGTTLELRFPILKPRTIYFTAVSLPSEFSVWRFGISLAIFCDAGRVWFRGDGLTLSSFYSGYGGGIYFLLPYSMIVRTEYAFNEYFKGQFILNFRTPI